MIRNPSAFAYRNRIRRTGNFRKFVPQTSQTQVNRYLYGNSIQQFLLAEPEEIFGLISQNSRLDDNLPQKDSWTHEIVTLQASLGKYEGEIYFEYSIPRFGRRADVILLIGGVVFVLEYKVGATGFERADIEQVWDYALDLKYFHEKSHSLWIAPVLIATLSREISHELQPSVYDDRVLEPLCCNDEGLTLIIDKVIARLGSDASFDGWAMSRFNPTPTIIQAATVLYRRKNLENKSIADITRTEASGASLQRTSDAVLEIVREAEALSRKSICFVTGVPGAGKTLVGLNIAINLFDRNKTKDAQQDRSLAVYLSGNGPLVKVLREALARDAVAQEKAKDPRTKYNKTRAHKAVDSFIMDVYHHRDYVMQLVGKPIDASEGIKVNPKVAPDDGASWLPEHVDIFDEAQRSWTKDQLSNWLSRKKGIRNFNYSEPEFLIWGLDRKQDWAVIVCLVGGGQEINTGEAGISTWLAAIRNSFPSWHVYYPENLRDKEYANGQIDSELESLPPSRRHPRNDLHLSVSQRSFRAENFSKFVGELLDVKVEQAAKTLATFSKEYPIALTRDLEKAKNWLRSHARGSERYGLLVSSQAYRLRPLSIDVRCKPDTVHWFLDDITDIRSSLFMEDVATEFDVQGLELDWAGIVWDGDMVYDPSHLVLSAKDRRNANLTADSWTHRSFNGGTWQNIASDLRRMYQINAYRVLLTRSRQGMIICVPEGNSQRNIDGSFQDPTRLPLFYDGTYEYLRSLGIRDIDEEEAE